MLRVADEARSRPRWPRAVHTWLPSSTHGRLGVRPGGRRASRSSSGSPSRAGGGAVVARLRDAGLGQPDLGVEDVARDLQEGRARRAVEALAERHGRPCRRRARSSGTVAANLVIGVIMSTCGRSCSEPILCWRERALAADEQHRALGAEGVGDAGDGVGGARAGGDDRAAGLAGHARVAVGGVRGDLLMADVDDLDALVDAAVVDVDDVAAAEREDRVDALGLQRLGDQVAAGDRFRCRVRWLGHSGSSRLCSPYCIPYEGNGYPPIGRCLALLCGQSHKLHRLAPPSGWYDRQRVGERRPPQRPRPVVPDRRHALGAAPYGNHPGVGGVGPHPAGRRSRTGRSGGPIGPDRAANHPNQATRGPVGKRTRRTGRTGRHKRTGRARSARPAQPARPTLRGSPALPRAP